MKLSAEEYEERKGKIIIGAVLISCFIFFGIFFLSNMLRTESSDNYSSKLNENEVEVEEKGESVSKYFKVNINRNEYNDIYYKTDPFIEICVDSSIDNVPNVSSNTVCLR